MLEGRERRGWDKLRSWIRVYVENYEDTAWSITVLFKKVPAISRF